MAKMTVLEAHQSYAFKDKNIGQVNCSLSTLI